MGSRKMVWNDAGNRLRTNTLYTKLKQNLRATRVRAKLLASLNNTIIYKEELV